MIKGSHMTEESKRKIGDTLRGRVFSEEVRRNMGLSKKGMEPWNKGKTGVYTKEHIEFLRKIKIGFKHTERAKEKLRDAGRNISEETRRKRSEAVKGEKCWNWQGGKTSEQKIIRHSLELRLWRESVFKRDDWTCQDCGERGGVLNAHHLKPFAEFPELRTSIENGITLCKRCHVNRHKIKREE